MPHELWITGLFNRYLGGIAAGVIKAIHYPSPIVNGHPWTDWMVCEILVVLFILVFFGWARTQFSVDRPGRVQHVLELTYDFFRASTEESVGHDGLRYLPFFGTIFIFILFLNIIGLIPGFESPTMYTMVPLGFAVTTFVFYHYAGIREHHGAYIKQFLGGSLALAVIMFPIEIISHFARPFSLTVRLFANMFAGEQVFLTFVQLTKLLVPVVFIGLHLFVSFLQAYIFMLLAMVYVGGAVAHEH